MSRREFLSRILPPTLLLGVTCAAPAARRERTPLLPEDSHPPHFRLPDSGGSLVAFDQFLGHKRVALVFQPSVAYLNQEMGNAQEYRDRDLVLLAVVTPGSRVSGSIPSTATLHVLTDKTGDVFQAYRAGPGQRAFYLIGKDGTIKMAHRTYPSREDLFGAIDAMPMRRQEMRERNH